MKEEDKVSQAIMDNTKRQLKQQTDSIYDSLVGQRDNSQLPEEIFVGYFLPFFSGQRPITDNSQVVAEWISIAGTPMNEVDVISPSGDTIFSVPSLFDTNMIDVVSREVGQSISDIYAQYDLKSNNIQSVANNFLNKELSKKLKIIDSNVDHAETTHRWNDILTRYGIPVQQQSMSKESSNDLDDDVIY